MDKTNINDVVLMGGSTCILKVQNMLHEFFSGKELCRKINPDEAYDAAIQTSILGGRNNDERLLDMILRGAGHALAWADGDAPASLRGSSRGGGGLARRRRSGLVTCGGGGLGGRWSSNLERSGRRRGCSPSA